MKRKNYSIIGSGIGSLTAGATLARQGHKVEVFEKFDQVGGYATLFKRKGFTFDVSLHQVGGVHRSGLNRILKAAGVYNRITYLKHAFLTEMEAVDGTYLAIPNGDPLTFQNELIKRFPAEKKVIIKWFTVMKRYGVQFGIHSLRYRSPFHQAIIDLCSPLLIPQILKGSRGGVLLNKTFDSTNAELKEILTHFSLYYGLPIEEINQLFPMVANYGYYYDGGYYIKGGGHELAKQLVNVIQENGGSVHTSSTVTAVNVTNASASSIEINGTQKIEVDNVIMSGSPAQLYGSLIKGYNKSSELFADTKALDISITASVLYVALDCPIGELNPQLKDAYEFTYQSPLKEKEFYDLFTNKRDFDSDYSQWPISLSIHSNIDPTCLPESGGTCFDIFVADNYDRWAALSPEEYREQKSIETEKLISHLETKLPGIRNHLVVTELGTPKTMERYTGNPKGAFYGFSQNSSQTMFKRTAPRSAVKNIEFASAWTRPGGGYEGAMESGYRVAHKSKVSGFIIMAIFIALLSSLPLIL